MLRTLPLNNGFRMPVIGIGTWEMGGREKASPADHEQSAEALLYAIQTGFTHIDTAEMYGDGEAERIVATATRQSAREELFITTKIKPSNLNKDRLRKSAGSSLERLRTHYVDALLIHAPNPEVPVAGSLEEMLRLRSEGLARCIGVSNFSLAQLEEVEKLFPGEIAICQNEYSLQAIETGLYTFGSHSQVIPFCLSHNIAFTGWRPLGKGKLLQTPDPVLSGIAAKHEASTAQIALSWTIHRPGTSTLVKASGKNHITENYRAADIILSDDDYRLLTDAYLNRERH